jgi:hypothetical protein
MKHNNIYSIKLAIIFAFAFLLTACMDDFLDRQPLSSIATENYLTDEKHLEAYSIQQYNFSFSGSVYPYEADIHSDNQSGRGYSNIWIPGQVKVGKSGGAWDFTRIYKLNYFLNTVLPRYEAGKITGNIAAVKHYIGEVYFLRAYEYFDRLKDLGDFPILTETLPNENDKLIEASKRRPRNEVARFIIQDLDKAIALLNNAPAGAKNRITLDLAYLMKSRVALFEGTWLKYHNGTALVPLGPNWTGAAKDYNSNYAYPSGSIENEINYFLDQAMAASKVVANKITLVSNSKFIKETATTAPNLYFEMFNSVSLATTAEVLLWRSFSNELGVKHTFNSAFVDGGANGFTRQFVDVFLMQDGLPAYASATYKGDNYIDSVKTNRDWRLRLFMKAPGEKNRFFNNGVAINVTTEPMPRIYNTSSNASLCSATGYDIKKGLSYERQMSATYGVDITAVPVFRAAEAYLNYIEACYVRTGVIDADADKYWKAIRTRAGVDPDYSKTIAATDLSKEAPNDWGTYSHGQMVNTTLYNIRRERRCEFMAEGFRWDDLRRWRALDQVQNFQPEGIKLWGPMQDLRAISTSVKLYKEYFVYGSADATKNNVSDPGISSYLRMQQIMTGSGNLLYSTGYNWCEAHYLDPIAVDHFIYTASDANDKTTSPIYQNPGWPIEADASPIGF